MKGLFSNKQDWRGSAEAGSHARQQGERRFFGSTARHPTGEAVYRAKPKPETIRYRRPVAGQAIVKKNNMPLPNTNQGRLQLRLYSRGAPRSPTQFIREHSDHHLNAETNQLTMLTQVHFRVSQSRGQFYLSRQIPNFHDKCNFADFLTRSAVCSHVSGPKLIQ